MNIIFEDVIKTAAPELKVLTIEAEVTNPDTSDELWNELCNEGNLVKNKFAMEQINKRPAIAATRIAYKNLGKEPNRYRPSAEALCRRLVKGMELYRINTLVDIINLISVRSGYSIGGFDAHMIKGDTLTLGAGRADEKFEAIGRGILNIEHLPVYRDETGAIGTPTSDTERTKLTSSTTKLLMCINVYGEEMPVNEVIEYSTYLLRHYAYAKNITISTYPIGK